MATSAAPRADQVELLRERLRTYNTDHADLQQEGSSRRTALLLLLSFLAVSVSTVSVGIYLRSSFWNATIGDSRGSGHIRLKITASPALEPYQHSQTAHAAAEVLKAMARSPGQMHRYMNLSSAEREDYLAEQVSSRPSVAEFLDNERCQGSTAIYNPLVNDMLHPFKGGLLQEHLRTVKQPPSATLYIKSGRMFLDGTQPDLAHPMTVLWAEYIYWLLQEVKLPDLVMPLNPDDFPRGKRDPWFSFCRQRRAFNDLLLPNVVEDGQFPVEASLRAPRAGKDDTRRPMAIWLGRPMSWGRGKRKAVVEEGRKHPEKVYAGLTDWNDVGLPEGVTGYDLFEYYKPRMPLDDWADHFKYVINVEGNCGSARLAKQLYGDAAVFFVSGEDEEWYYPLLKPFVHYIPVTVSPNGATDLLDQIAWAESHPDEVLGIVQASTEFAYKHLAPRNGRDCYSAMLLEGFAALIQNVSEIRPPQGLQAYVSQQPPWSRRTRHRQVALL